MGQGRRDALARNAPTRVAPAPAAVGRGADREGSALNNCPGIAVEPDFRCRMRFGSGARDGSATSSRQINVHSPRAFGRLYCCRDRERGASLSRVPCLQGSMLRMLSACSV